MNEKNNKPYYLVVGVLVAVAVVAGLIYLTNAPQTPGTKTPEDRPLGNIIEGNGTVVEETVLTPDFTRPLAFADTVDAEVRTFLQGKFDGLQETLKGNSTDFNAWVALGTLRKTAGDYAGAAEDWDYIARLYPNSTIPFDNLGDLYMNFIKNYPQAEANFKASLVFNPGNIHAYQQLFALYTTYGYKTDTTAAADLVAAGLAKNPGNATLLQMQQELQTAN